VDDSLLTQSVRDYYLFTTLDLATMSQNEMKAFINENNIIAKEVDDKYEISFQLNSNNLRKFLGSSEKEDPSRINGKLVMDKESHDLLSFSYDLMDFYKESLKEGATLNLEAFHVNGESLKNSYPDITLDGEFETYTEGMTFLGDLIAEMELPIA
nr:hypothetical protein [Bacilli bacterium]